MHICSEIICKLRNFLAAGKRIHLMAPCSALQWDLLERTHTLESLIVYSWANYLTSVKFGFLNYKLLTVIL